MLLYREILTCVFIGSMTAELANLLVQKATLLSLKNSLNMA